MSAVRTSWGISAAELTPARYGKGNLAESEKARHFELHARKIALAGPIPSEVIVRLIDRGDDPSDDGRYFAWVTEL